MRGQQARDSGSEYHRLHQAEEWGTNTQHGNLEGVRIRAGPSLWLWGQPRHTSIATACRSSPETEEGADVLLLLTISIHSFIYKSY